MTSWLTATNNQHGYTGMGVSRDCLISKQYFTVGLECYRLGLGFDIGLKTKTVQYT